jgi:hypothetical protein
MSLSIAALIALLFLSAGYAGGAPSGDEGFGLDPNGRARAAACDAGSQMDPNGCPRHASSDSSVILDPNGRGRVSTQAGIRADQNG